MFAVGDYIAAYGKNAVFSLTQGGYALINLTDIACKNRVALCQGTFVEDRNCLAKYRERVFEAIADICQGFNFIRICRGNEQTENHVALSLDIRGISDIPECVLHQF